MMDVGNTNRRTVDVKDRRLIVSPDDPVPIGLRHQALIRARVFDEISSNPPRASIRVNTSMTINRNMLKPRIAQEGIVGLTGVPANVFPNLNNQDYSLRFFVEVEGFLPQNIGGQVQQQPNFPDTFEVPPWIEIPLHRNSIRLKGGVFRQDGNTLVPIDGAQVSIVNICQHPDTTCRELSGPFPPLRAFHFAPGIYSEQLTNAATVRRVEVNDTPDPLKRLVSAAACGATTLRLSNSDGLVVDDLLRIEQPTSDRVEYIQIKNIYAGQYVTDEAEVELAYALAFSHVEGATIREVTIQSPGAQNNLNENAIQGDSTVFLASIHDLATAEIIEVVEGGNSPEYHRLFSYSGTTANGTSHLPPISRVDSVRVRVRHGIHTKERTVTLDYNRVENYVQFVFA